MIYDDESRNFMEHKLVLEKHVLMILTFSPFDQNLSSKSDQERSFS